MVTQHIKIEGKVQGVFYRATAKEKAVALGLKGWIRNTAEGAVEALVSGEEAVVQEFVEWSKKGPALAQVKQVIISVVEQEIFEGFEIRKNGY